MFRCTQGLQAKYGKTRCFDAPINESGIVGAAVGMAAYGLRPCVEIQFADYMYPAYDQIVSEAARLRYRSNGEFTCPIVVRMPTGGGISGGQTHSQSPEALFTHVAGLKTVVPSTPGDAKGLLIAAIEDPDPVIFLEPKRLYDASFEESEDHELWSRVLEVSDGDNLPDPLVLYRVHPQQASQRRRGLQRDVPAARRPAAIAASRPRSRRPRSSSRGRSAAREPLDGTRMEAAVDAYLELVAAFESRWGSGARERAARDLMRVAKRASGTARARIVGHALRLDPGLPLHVAAAASRAPTAGPARREGEGWLRRLARDGSSTPIRVAAVFPEPTPYRAPLLDRVAAHPEIDLTVLYAADTVAGRTWRVEPHAPRRLPARAAPSGRAAAPPSRLPGDARNRRRADGRAARRRGRLGLEHVRGAGRDRMVRAEGRARTCSSSRATTRGLAPDGGERSRARSSRRSSSVRRASSSPARSLATR